MDPYKLARQNSAILKVLSEVISVDIKDPRVGFVSINEVRLNRDQTVAEVFFSVLGEKKDKLDSLRGLKKARGYLQSRLGDILRLRRMPDLQFVLDDAVERGLGIDAILSDLHVTSETDDEAARRATRTFISLVPPVEMMNTLRAAERVWVVPHWHPDPDAMGSTLALTAALKAVGKEAVALGYPDSPSCFASLPGFDDVLLSTDASDAFDASPPDLVMMVDCHSLDRSDELAAVLERAPAAWCVDHHLVDGTPLPGWIEPTASSASLLVMRVIELLAEGADGDEENFDFDEDMAANIYAGLVTDTGGFRFPNTLPLTFEAAEQLARTGIDTTEITENVLHRRTRGGMELLKLVMATFTFHHDGGIVSLRAERSMLAETDTHMSDTEGFVNLATAVEGVRFAVFLKEREDGCWRVSMRAVGDGDVQSVAADYDGGGHKLAAGCTIEGDPDEVLADLVEALRPQLEG
jgi:bifunctional oligoribonuclease and PAP phosphatase NrnA